MHNIIFKADREWEEIGHGVFRFSGNVIILKDTDSLKAGHKLEYVVLDFHTGWIRFYEDINAKAYHVFEMNFNIGAKLYSKPGIDNHKERPWEYKKGTNRKDDLK